MILHNTHPKLHKLPKSLCAKLYGREGVSAFIVMYLFIVLLTTFIKLRQEIAIILNPFSLFRLINYMLDLLYNHLFIAVCYVDKYSVKLMTCGIEILKKLRYLKIIQIDL